MKFISFEQHLSSGIQDKRWDDCLPLPLLSALTASCLLFGLAVICFVASYDGEFVFDDAEAILSNKDVSQNNFSDLIQHDFWGNKLTNRSHKSYRPITVLTFRWNYQVAGGLFPWGFHLVNILLHALSSVIILHVFSLLFGERSVFLPATMTGTMDGDKHVSKVALLAAIIFAVHPVHTESVAAVVGRADLLCAVFFLFSFLSYAAACVNNDNGRISRPRSIRYRWMMMSVFLCFLSTFSKEQGITVISVGSWMVCFAVRQLILLTTFVLLLLLRFKVMGVSPQTFQVHDNPHSFVNGTLYRSLNYNYIYGINVWLLLNPWWLCFDWSMGCIPTIESIADVRLVAVVILWIFIGCLVCYVARGELDHKKRSVVMALAVMAITFLPASNLFFRVGFVIAERNLYLPLSGYCILFSLGAVQISSFRHLREVTKVALYGLVLIFISRCIQRSIDWRTELLLYTQGAKVCPLNGKVHYNIAKLQADDGKMDIAVREYRTAIRLNPVYDQAMNNLANILKERGENREAEELLSRAVSINPQFAAAWMNLGIVQANRKMFQHAEASYQTAIRHRPNYPDCYYNLGNVYLDERRHQEALLAWYNATLLSPQHLNSWTNAIILLDNLGKHQQAVELGVVALRQLPGSPSLWFHVGNVRGKLSQWSESERCFLKAIELSPNQSNFQQNLGVLYHRWGKLQQAKQAYTRSLELDPDNPNAQDNLAMLVKKIDNS